MNSPSAAFGSVTQSHALQLRAQARRHPPDHPHSFPESVSQDHLPLTADELQRHPGRPWDTERSNRSGASSPPFQFDSANSSAQSLQVSGPSPVPPKDIRQTDSPLLPSRARDGVSPGPKPAASPLSQLNWAAQSASARNEVHNLREAIIKMTTALAETRGKVDELIQIRGKDGERFVEIGRQIIILDQHAQRAAQLQEIVQVKDGELRGLIAQSHDRVDALQNQVKNLTELCIDNTEDKFEAQGPLPRHYRRIQTSNGPYALHNDVYRRLIPYLDFHAAQGGQDGRPSRTHVEVSRQMLSHLAMWKNGLSLAPELIGFAGLRDLCAYARNNDLQDLLGVTLKELHEAGVAAMAPVISKHPRHTSVKLLGDAMVRAMCDLQTKDDAQQAGKEAVLQVLVPRPPQGIVRPGPLLGGEDRTPEWRQDLTFAFRAFTLYCGVFRVTCHGNPVIEVRDNDRHLILHIPCDSAA